MNRLAPLAAVILLIPLSAVRAGELPTTEPGKVRLAAKSGGDVRAPLKKLVDDGKTPGGIVPVARHGKVAYFATFGYRDLASKAPMTDDAIFAIASMSKPITCVAFMTLVEQ